MNEVESTGERRENVRIPVTVGFKCNITGTDSEFFYTTEINNFSAGGMCITWRFCDACSGYTEGKIHPDCIFSPYDYHSSESGELIFHIELANYEQDLNFRGKAVYTLKQKSDEKIGIAFTDISDSTLEFMHKVFGG